MLDPASSESPAKPATERLHYLDLARAVLLLLLGIPYHAAQPYSSRAWFIHSETHSRLAELAGGFSHQFRMHAFFLVAGFFAALILGKRGALVWMRDRAKRLLIPFLTMLVLVLPAQAMILGMFEHGDAMAGLARMQDDARLSIAHSWFLRDLFLYCALLAVVWPHFVPLRVRFGGGALLAGALVSLALWKPLVNLLATVLLAHMEPTFVYGLSTFLSYLPFFVLGALIRATPGLLAVVTRYSAVGLGLAVTWLVLSTLLIPRDDFGFGPAAMLNPLNGLIGSWALITVARRFLDRPSALVDFFVGGALIIYIVHLGFVFLFTGLLRGTGVPPTIAWLLVTTLTLAACAASYALIRRLPPLYFLLNGQARPAPRGDARGAWPTSRKETRAGDDAGEAVA